LVGRDWGELKVSALGWLGFFWRNDNRCELGNNPGLFLVDFLFLFFIFTTTFLWVVNMSEIKTQQSRCWRVDAEAAEDEG
jgi:hypothetical protein